MQDGEDEGAVENDLLCLFRGETAGEADGCGGFGFGAVAVQFDLCFVGELFVLRGRCGQGGEVGSWGEGFGDAQVGAGLLYVGFGFNGEFGHACADRCIGGVFLESLEAGGCEQIAEGFRAFCFGEQGSEGVVTLLEVLDESGGQIGFDVVVFRAVHHVHFGFGVVAVGKHAFFDLAVFIWGKPHGFEEYGVGQRQDGIRGCGVFREFQASVLHGGEPGFHRGFDVVGSDQGSVIGVGEVVSEFGIDGVLDVVTDEYRVRGIQVAAVVRDDGSASEGVLVCGDIGKVDFGQFVSGFPQLFRQSFRSHTAIEGLQDFFPGFSVGSVCQDGEHGDDRKGREDDILLRCFCSQ